MQKRMAKFMGFVFVGVHLESAIYFFADDTLMLINATASSATCLQHILNMYEHVSEQMINKEKTSIMFSPNTSAHVKDQVLATFGVEHTANNEKYMGLSIYIGKSKKRTFE
jgi:hypothetical protein